MLKAVSSGSGGSGGTPGGSDTQIQFNDAGSFGGSAALTLDKTTGVLTQNSAGDIYGAFILNSSGVPPIRIPHANSIHIIGSDATYPAVYLDGSSKRAVLNGYVFGGTVAARTFTLAGSESLRISGRGYDGTNRTGSQQAISFYAGEDVTPTAQGGWLGFRTAALGTVPGGDETSPPLVAAITPSGGFILGAGVSYFTTSGINQAFLTIDPGQGIGLFQNGVIIGAGSAITSSGPGGVLGTGAFVATGTSGATVPLNNGGFTQSGTANFTGTFQINGNAITWPAAAISVARTDAPQSLTGLQTVSASSGTAGVTLVGDGVSAAIIMTRYQTVAGGPTVNFQKARGTLASPLVVVAGDNPLFIQFQGMDANGGTFRSLGNITGTVDTVTGSNDISGKITFNTRPDGSAAAVAQALLLTKNQSAVVGSAAIATTSTDGFIYIPAAAGTPTGTPTTIAGFVPLYLDTTNSQLWLYMGGAWKQPKTPAGASLVTWQ